MATHEELYLHISAETFETVDAAVALIELLVTPVSVSFCCLEIMKPCLIHVFSVLL